MNKHYLISLLSFIVFSGLIGAELHPSKEALVGFLSLINDKTKEDFSKIDMFLSEKDQTIYENDKKLESKINRLQQNYKEIAYGLYRNWSVDQRKQIDALLKQNIDPIFALKKVAVHTETELGCIASDRSFINTGSLGLGLLNTSVHASDQLKPTFKMQLTNFQNGDRGLDSHFIEKRVPAESITVVNTMGLLYSIFQFGASIFKNKQHNKIVARHEQISNVILKSSNLALINQDFIDKQSNQ